MSQIIEYLTKNGIQFKRRGEELQCNCPFCDDKERKFSINAITGLYNCLHLNTCGAKGDWYSYQKKMGARNPEKLNIKKDMIGKEKKSYVRPQHDCPPMRDDQVEVYKYLKSRGFSDATIKHFRVGADTGTVKLPYFKNGVLTNIKYRAIANKKMWQENDAEPLLFNRDNIENNVLTICEGEFDAMALHEYGIQAVSVPGGAGNLDWVAQEWDYLESFKHILICFDNDQAGKDGAAKLAARLGYWRCSIVTLPMKDANDCLISKIPADKIADCFAYPAELSPETLVSPDYYMSDVQEIFRQGTQMFGTPTPWTALTDILKGWRNSELTIWSGRNGSGKSTVLNQVILDAAAKGEKSCIYSGEMPPPRYLRWAVIQHKENPSPPEYIIADSLTWMTGKIYILNTTGTITPTELLDNFEYAARRYGVKHFVIDSLMKIKINQNDEYNQQKEFMDLLTDFQKTHKSHIHLVAHPRKTPADTDEPGKVDVKGSSHITDVADNVLVLYRTSEEQKEKSIKKGVVPADMVLFVKKNREFGVEGKVQMWFDDMTKKFRCEELK